MCTSHHHRGASIKTRKRNIAVPLDPSSFANAVIQIFEDSREPGNPVDKNLEAAGKVLDSAELDFKRYGDTFFEVLYVGGRMLGGDNIAEGHKMPTYVRGCCGVVSTRSLCYRSLDARQTRRRSCRTSSFSRASCGASPFSSKTWKTR